MRNDGCLQRVEKHIIKSSDSHFCMLAEFCHPSKNLYNHANYLCRDTFVKKGKWLRYDELDKMLRGDTQYPDYRNMPTAQSAQQILRLLDNNWKAFFTSIKDWSKHKEKYLGKPKMPKYLKKDGSNVLVLTNQNCKYVNGKILFPKVFNGFVIMAYFNKRNDFVSFQQVRFIPHKNRIVVEVVYKIRAVKEKQDNHRYIGIDIGVNNLATVCTSMGSQAFIINGRPLKSINQYYNKQVSHYRELCKRMNARDYSLRMDRLTERRNARIDDYLHKASRYIVNYCLMHHINTIVVGKNDGWKQKSVLSKRVNQNFVQIPFERFIQMIQYKAEEVGIAVILTEESYTSGTSFIDGEEPVKENYNKKRRVCRGLFRANNGVEVNADLNGAYQILRKVVPIKWNRGCVLHPAVVNIV